MILKGYNNNSEIDAQLSVNVTLKSDINRQVSDLCRVRIRPGLIATKVGEVETC